MNPVSSPSWLKMRTCGPPFWRAPVMISSAPRPSTIVRLKPSPRHLTGPFPRTVIVRDRNGVRFPPGGSLFGRAAQAQGSCLGSHSQYERDQGNGPFSSACNPLCSAEVRESHWGRNTRDKLTPLLTILEDTAYLQELQALLTTLAFQPLPVPA